MRLFKSHRPKAPADKRPATAPSERTPAAAQPEKRPQEVGGPEGPEPTRYGDWERKGLCTDF